MGLEAGTELEGEAIGPGGGGETITLDGRAVGGGEVAAATFGGMVGARGVTDSLFGRVADGGGGIIPAPRDADASSSFCLLSGLPLFAPPVEAFREFFSASFTTSRSLPFFWVAEESAAHLAMTMKVRRFCDGRPTRFPACWAESRKSESGTGAGFVEAEAMLGVLSGGGSEKGGAEALEAARRLTSWMLRASELLPTRVVPTTRSKGSGPSWRM